MLLLSAFPDIIQFHTSNSKVYLNVKLDIYSFINNAVHETTEDRFSSMEGYPQHPEEGGANY